MKGRQLHVSMDSTSSDKHGGKHKLDKLVADSLRDTAFMELFAGEAGLTLAVKRVVGKVFTPGDIVQSNRADVAMDLLDNGLFKAFTEAGGPRNSGTTCVRIVRSPHFR